MIKKLFIIAVALLPVSGLIAYKAIKEGYLRTNYPSFKVYSVQGIDISSQQNEIKWDAIEKKYAQFAFISATKGGTHRDPKFIQNWTEANKLDIPVSARHFFSFATKGTYQAQNYIYTVPKEISSLPPTIDLIYEGNCKPEDILPDLKQEINEFLEIVEKHYKKKVIIHTTLSFYKDYIINDYPDNPISIRDVVSTPKLDNNRKWLFWQYTDRGNLHGISTLAGMNAFAGNKEDLKKLTISNVE